MIKWDKKFILEAKLMQVVPHGSYARWEVVMVWLQEFYSYRVHSIVVELIMVVNKNLEIAIWSPMEVKPTVVNDNRIVPNILGDMRLSESALYQARARSARAQRACALRALGLLLADGTPTVGGGKTF